MITEKDRQIQMQDWLRLVDFGKSALKFNTAVGQTIDEMDIVRRPEERTKIKDYKRLSDLSDFRFFSMGPVYVACGIPFDIMGDFRAKMEVNKTPYEGPRIALEFANPVFGGLSEWDTRLEGVWASPEGYDNLVRFMISQKIRQKDSQTYWTVKYREIAIPDPMAVDRREYQLGAPETTAVIGVFLPSGNRYQVGLAPLTGYPPVGLIRGSPEAGVVQEAQFALNPEGPKRG